MREYFVLLPIVSMGTKLHSGPVAWGFSCTRAQLNWVWLHKSSVTQGFSYTGVSCRVIWLHGCSVAWGSFTQWFSCNRTNLSYGLPQEYNNINKMNLQSDMRKTGGGVAAPFSDKEKQFSVNKQNTKTLTFIYQVSNYLLFWSIGPS